jgi:hypothetical protein
VGADSSQHTLTNRLSRGGHLNGTLRVSCRGQKVCRLAYDAERELCSILAAVVQRRLAYQRLSRPMEEGHA